MGRRCPISKYKRLIITVAIGEGIRPFFETVSKPRFEAYAEKCGADFKALTTGGLDVNGNEVMQPWWGLEKMRVGLPAHTDGYDQILFVDADVIIQDFAPNIFDGHQMGKVGIQNDWDVLKSGGGGAALTH